MAGVSFNEVPASVRVPGVYIEIDNSLANTAEDLQRVLIVAPPLDADVETNKVKLTITDTTVADEFGKGSLHHKMAVKFMAQNEFLPVSCVAADDIATALAATGDKQYHYIVTAFNDDTSIRQLGDFLQDRYHALKQIPGIAFIAKQGNHAALVNYGVTTSNSPFVVCRGVNKLTDADGTEITEAEAAASYAGQVSGSLSIDPARPVQTLQEKTIYTGADSEWTWAERNMFLYSGISTYNTNDAGNVFIERAITMYKENATGVPDDSYLDVMVPATAMFYRAKQRSRILSKYPRHKLAADGTRFAPGQAIVTPNIIKSELIALYDELEYRGIVEDAKNYKKTLYVEIDPDNPNRVNVQDQPNFVNGLIIYAGKIQYKK